FPRCNGILSDTFERGIGAEGTRETLRIDFADMADAKPIEEAAQRDGPAGIDGLIQFAHGNRAEPIDVFQLPQRSLLPLLQGEDIGGRADGQGRIVGIEEEFDLLLAQSFDVEGIARYEM